MLAMTRPSVSRSGTTTDSHQQVVPSLRRNSSSPLQRPCFSSPSSTALVSRSASPGCSTLKSVWPSASGLLRPNMRSALGFQSMMAPARSVITTAS